MSLHKSFYFIGHRGTRIDYDENTKEAFQNAIKKGANVIELDIRQTQDEKLIIIHDSTLERTTSCSGNVSELSYAQIKQCLTKKRLKRVPLLSDILNEFLPKAQLMIELKGNNVEKKLLEIMKERNSYSNLIFSGRKLKSLERLKNQMPECQICYNITKGKDLTFSDFIRFGSKKRFKFKPEMISLRSSLVRKQFIGICHKNGIKALSWDFIDYDQESAVNKIKNLVKLGIDGILFDDYKNISIIKDWIGYS